MIPIVPVPPLPSFVQDASAPISGPMTDRRGRVLRDLRISVTDRCNFRCVYCMPKTAFNHEHAFLPRTELLSFEEITRIARLFAAQGVRKIRLTGGEPLLRHGIDDLIAMLASIPDVEITLTTNGSLLKKRAEALKRAGLSRVTVSLDALDDQVFKAMNDMNYPVHHVLEGIEAAAAAGLGPVKVNMVVKKGSNDQEVLPLAEHFRHSGHIMRYIEYMDVGTRNGWKLDEVLPSAQVVQRIHGRWPLSAIDPAYNGEVAERWRYQDGAGEIGVISSVTQAFCHTCTRLRLSTDGKLYTCLFADQGHDLRQLLRQGGDDELLSRYIRGLWQQRHDNYSERRTAETAGLSKIEMSYIGG